MNFDKCNCTKCGIIEKICRLENGNGPAWCSTRTGDEILSSAMEGYNDPEVKEFARLASVQEGCCYANRDALRWWK